MSEITLPNDIDRTSAQASLEQRVSCLERDMRRLQDLLLAPGVPHTHVGAPNADADLGGRSSISDEWSDESDPRAFTFSPRNLTRKVFPDSSPMRRSEPQMSGALVRCCDPGSDDSSSEERLVLKHGLPEEAHKAMSSRAHCVEKSAWDAALFMGHSLFGTSGTVMLAVGLLFNIILQFSFCYIISASDLASNGIMFTEEEAEKWRVHHGHSCEYADPVTGKSLVARVCEGDGSLLMSDEQKGMVRLIDTYFTKDDQGRILARCVVLLFALAIGSELQSTSYFVCGLWGIQRDRSTRFRFEGGSFILETISPCRLCAGCAISFARATVAFVLFFIGSRWLVRTLDIEDLLLNAVALSFVVGIDEMVYSIFTPNHLDKVLDSLRPLDASRSVLVRHVLRASKLVILFSLVLYFTVVELEENSRFMRTIRGKLCDGHQDFIYGFDPAGALYITSSDIDHAGSDKIIEVREKAIWNVIDVEDWSANTLWPTVEFTSMQHFLHEMHLDVESMSAAIPSCTDSEPYFNRTKYLSTGDESVQVCADVKKYCNSRANVAARLFCPETCGCDSPVSGLVRRTHDMGCPWVCEESDIFKSHLERLPCQDRSLAELQADAAWKKLFYGLKLVVNEKSTTTTAEEVWSEEVLARTDCAGMFDLLRRESLMFNGTNMRLGRPLEFVCGGGMAAFCPTTCWCTDVSMQAEWREMVPELADFFFSHWCSSACGVGKL